MPNQGMPVTIVTGFLGSGKTTLLNHILQNQQGLKIAVLVNEFGSINIDSQLLIAADKDMMQLSNGCICCSMNDGLIETIYDILEREETIDYLVVETSGVADPLPLALTFIGTELKHFTRLDSILTVVDAEMFSPEFLNSEAALNQVAYGDIILLNKVDLVSLEQVKAAESHIHQVKEGARILHCSHGVVPLHMILDVGLTSPAQQDGWQQLLESPAQGQLGGVSTHLKNDGFDSLSFTSDRPFDVNKFQHFLTEQLPDNIYRAKGLLWFQWETERFIFQLSGKRYTLNQDQWPTKPSNQLVLIGRNLDKLMLMQHLNNCLSRR
ncbi:CobW family GTP-binding protein [[Limnothrix rosea] IAM M-220]|uniref:CobW family GTP-binding protein n=1 Tax=[Limnothrix rosea] IAM M-220 TaxID=454133 RepID=UPI001CEC7B98|nr:GTP-binding protein [[Limnothrix rosea] IAM M-220]